MSEPTNEEIADVLDGARDRLIAEGWRKFGKNRREGEDGYCILGAIAAACGMDLEARVIDVVRDHGGFEYGTDVFMWNDEDDTTEDDVHDLLLNTAKALREDAAS